MKGDETGLLVRGARVMSLDGSVGAIDGADVAIEDGRIASVGVGLAVPDGANVIEARGRVLMPGFVDCHTHACWAGDRLDEWTKRLAGVPYLDILRGGGGIMSTVRAVRAATQEQLTDGLVERLDRMLAGGTTTAEVKSGYGLTTEDELKMLRAIAGARASWSGTLIATALLGHAIDAAESGFVDRVIRETLPAVSAEFPGITVDAFCEQGAWSLADTVRLMEAARERGHPVRVHADQFNSLGMTPEAIRLGAVSVDHLEASTEADVAALAASRTFAVGLPLCGLHMADGRFANLRKLTDAGAKVAIATNFNPGSAPSGSMALAIGAAVRYCGLTPHEAIAAATAVPAELLARTGAIAADRGAIRVGARADLILLRHHDERALAYELGEDSIDLVICDGAVQNTRG